MIVYKKRLSLLVVLVLMITCIPINCFAATNPYSQEIHYLMLYDKGDECIDVTGGWDITGWGVGNWIQAITPFDKYVNYMGGSSPNSSTWAGTATVNKVDVSDYTGLCAVADTSAGSQNFGVAVKDQKSVRDSGLPYKNFYCNGGLEVFHWDISSINGEYYITPGANNNVGLTKIYSIALTKPDDIATLANKAGLTESTLLTDASTLLSNEDAVNFMLSQCTGDFMAEAVQNNSFLSALESSPYKDKIYANEHWNKFLNIMDTSYVQVPARLTSQGLLEFSMGDVFTGVVNVKYNDAVESTKDEECIWEVVKR